MKQINFSHPGGFPLEQETLDRLQTAFRHELFEALKSHLGIDPAHDYIVATPKNGKEGWAIIHPKNEQGIKTIEGILYPIQQDAPTQFLKTTRTGTNLTYGTGVLQTAYFDYEAQYISPEDYANRPGSPSITDALAIHYYDLKDPAFIIIKDIKEIESILDAIDVKIKQLQNDIVKIENDISTNYLPLNGSKAMKGDLDLGPYRLSKLDIREGTTANVRVTDFRLGSNLGRALVNDSTKLTLNAGSDWQNTAIGGNVYLENLNTSDSTKSLLVIDNSNQVTKNNTLIDSLISRIIKLETQPVTAVPLGMIAIWDQPKPFPEGWEEYTPLSGRVPVGVDIFDSLLNKTGNLGGSKNAVVVSHDHTITDSGNVNNNLPGGEISNKIARWDRGSGSLLNGTVSTVGESGTNKNMQPYNVVYFIKYTGIPGDTTKPTAPINLEVVTVRNKSVTLKWLASTDNVAVTDYMVSINGATPISVGNVLSSDITNLLPSTAYSFYVIAQDAAGNISAPSNTANTNTTNEIVLNTPQNIRSFLKTNDQITIEWDPITNNVGKLEYELWRKTFTEDYRLLVRPYENNITVYGEPYKTYYFKVRAIDAAGNKSEFTEEVREVTLPVACFDVESLVTMSSGQSKKLKNIVVGDKLQGLTFPNEIDESEGDYMLWNGKLNEGTKTEVTVVNKKTSIQPNYYEIKTADTLIKVTGEHPLLITEDGENVKYVSTKNIVETMSLIDKNGKTKAIESILFKEESLEVALLDVEDVDNYVISGIVAHNKDTDPV